MHGEKLSLPSSLTSVAAVQVEPYVWFLDWGVPLPAHPALLESHPTAALRPFCIQPWGHQDRSRPPATHRVFCVSSGETKCTV